ncbi:MAG TPA: hypothetical protein P5077_06185 [bacterium]|nr:hypothetical protein [bacterium]
MRDDMMRSCFFLLVVLVFLMGDLFADAPKKKGENKVTMDAMLIEGKIERPEAQMFLVRAGFRYQMLDLQVSFLPKVQEAIFSEDAF